MLATHYIAVDWGTSRLRAFLCEAKPDGSFRLLARSSGLGVSKSPISFEETLLHAISAWERDYGKLPILMAGQIGSSIGWKETPYLPCPISPDELAKSCLSFECHGYNIRIVPGLSCQLENDNYDCMRSEELQILGWLQLNASHRLGRHLLCLPGTHTKWVLVEDGKIKLFKTAMTGELFDLIVNNSVLIQSQAPEFNLAAFEQDAFDKGASFTLNSELGSFMHGLFSVRSKQLFGQLSSEQAISYLSGLLIGSDIRAALNATEWALTSVDKVVIIGAPHLSKSFARVLASQNIASELTKVTNTTLMGFNAVYSVLVHSAQMTNAANKVNPTDNPRTRQPVELLFTIPAQCQLGEGAQWNVQEQAIYWVDILGSKIQRYSVQDKSIETFDLAHRIGCFAFTENKNQIIVAFDKGIARYCLESKKTEWLTKPEAHLKLNRFNDGKADRQGRFWAGTMCEIDDLDSPATTPGALYCVSSDKTEPAKPIDNILISNALCWSRDGSTMYHADSPKQVIKAYDFCTTNASISNERIFATTQGHSFPDGATVDADDHVWCAQWGASQVVRYSPEGKITAVVKTPVSQPTCVAVGGPNMDWLIVTSAKHSLDNEQLASEPEAGDVFVYQLSGVRGLEEPKCQLDSSS
jgi:2-dehydro-3-deoxygalactonokinase